MLPPGPVITLVYRVAPERRSELLSFLREALQIYERPGGIRVGLYESLDDPGLLLELVAYRTEHDYLQDQERVEHDPEMKQTLSTWRALLASPVEVRRLRPVDLAG